MRCWPSETRRSRRSASAWVEAFLADGGTLLFCAHNTYQIKKLCGKAVWLDHGRVRAQGAASQRGPRSMRSSSKPGVQNGPGADMTARPPALAGGENRVTEVRLLDGHAQETSQFQLVSRSGPGCGSRAGAGETKPPVIHVGIVRTDLTPVYGVSSDMDGAVPRRCAGHAYRIDYVLPRLSLLPRPLCAARPRHGTAPACGCLALSSGSSRCAARTVNSALCSLPHSWET